MQEFNAKLSDFGLAKAGPTGDRTHVSTQVMGTHGYAAPEYVATGRFDVSIEYYCCLTLLLPSLILKHFLVIGCALEKLDLIMIKRLFNSILYWW